MRHFWLCVVALAIVSTPASAAPQARPGFDVNARISPDGRWILFDRYFSSGNRYAPPSHSLRIVDSDGHQERELLPETVGTDDAKWTPGNLIHVTRGSEAFLLDP